MICIYVLPPTPESTAYNADLTACRIRALQYTYGVKAYLVSSPKKMFFTPGVPVVSLEETSLIDLSDDFDHPEDCYYIAGNSKYSELSNWVHVDYKINIPVPNPEHPLYGDQALAILLQDRYAKSIRNI